LRNISSSALLGIFGILATLFAAFVAAYVTYDIHSKGDSPKREVEVSYFSTTDPLDDLNDASPRLIVDVKSGDRSVRNLRTVSTRLENSGAAPILPGDIYEPFSIKAQVPWKIVNVVPSYDDYGLKWKWNIPGNDVASAEKALLNPGDTVWVTVYLTSDVAAPKSDKPKIEWAGRVVNMKDIIVRDPQKELEAEMGSVVVVLGTSNIIFILIYVFIHSTLALLLLKRAKLLNFRNSNSYFFAAISILIGVCASEALATYFFPSYLSGDFSYLMNMPVIILDFIMLVGLYYLGRHTASRPRVTSV
jgi:hypothetical protein